MYFRNLGAFINGYYQMSHEEELRRYNRNLQRQLNEIEKRKKMMEGPCCKAYEDCKEYED